MKRISLILCVLILCKGCAPTTKSESISIYVAASLAPVLGELAIVYKKQRGIELILNSASSGTLARQIEQGAPADLFISANEQWVDYLSQKKLISKQQRLPVTNRLVLVVPFDSPAHSIELHRKTDFINLLGGDKVAIGDPNHVPAGQYTVQALQYFNWSLPPEQTLNSKDARAALVTVELGEAAFGIVYQTDATKSRKVKVISTFSDKSHSPIYYFAGICSENKLSADFIRFLNTPKALEVWGKYGFTG